jgi:hypothetical protein
LNNQRCGIATEHALPNNTPLLLLQVHESLHFAYMEVSNVHHPTSECPRLPPDEGDCGAVAMEQVGAGCPSMLGPWVMHGCKLSLYLSAQNLQTIATGQLLMLPQVNHPKGQWEGWYKIQD